MRIGLKTKVALVMSGWAAFALAAEIPQAKTTLEEVYRAQPFKPVVQMHNISEEINRSWEFDDGSLGGFTSFEGFETPRVEDGKLILSAPGPEATLGWGNYKGAQKPEERVLLWPVRNAIQMRVRQTIAPSNWAMIMWADGKPDSPIRYFTVNTDKASHSSSEWETLTFEATQYGADGFELKLSNMVPGNKIEIDWVRVMRPEAGGCFRRSFTIPQGAKVWRAVGSVAAGTQLYVNGKPLDCGFVPAKANRGVMSLDMAPYLVEGENVVAMTGSFQTYKDVFIYFQGSVILENGQIINLDGANGWKVNAAGSEGWMQPGFKDGEWQNAEAVKREDPSFPTSNYTYSLYRSSLFPLVEYDGLIQYRNSANQKLIFRSEQPVSLQVLLPPGLAQSNPQVDWTLRRVEQLSETGIRQGTASKFAAAGEAIACNINLDQLPQGTYTIESVLALNGKQTEKRYRTPFLVYGKTLQQEVAGASYTEGIDHELEEQIDFTNPADPHEWIEVISPRKDTQVKKEANVVKTENLVFREIQGDAKGSFLSYKFQLKNPGDWYIGEIEYPNDKTRKFGISISRAYEPKTGEPAKEGFFTDVGPGVMTGNYNPTTGKMQTFRWIFRAEAGQLTLDLINHANDSARAAAANVKFYHVKGNLPALKVPENRQRYIGVHIERPYYLGVTFGSEMPSPFDFYYKAKRTDFLGHYIYRIAWFNDVAKHYTEYMRFTGQNFHVMGAYQYHEENWSYAQPNRFAGSTQVPCDIRDTLLAWFDANGISSMSLVEFNQSRNLVADFGRNNVEVKAGRETTMQVLKDGNQVVTNGPLALQNQAHPLVEAALLDTIRDLAMKSAEWPGWKGIYFMPYTGPYGFGPAMVAFNDPLAGDYSDAAMVAFTKDTGIVVPGEGPERFKTRFEFLTSQAQLQRWLDWRCQRQARLALLTRDVLRQFRPDLVAVMANYEPRTRIDTWGDKKMTYDEVNRLWGFDPQYYKQNDGTWYCRYYWPNLPHKEGKFSRLHRISPEVNAHYDAEVGRIAAIRDDWLEIQLIVPPELDWPWQHTKSRTLPQSDLDNRKEIFVQALAGNDPQIILFGFADIGEFVGQEDQTRELVRQITTLPAQKLSLMEGTGSDKPVAVRSGKVDDKFYFFVANCENTPKTIRLSLAAPGDIFTAADGTRIAVDGGKVDVTLGAYGLQSFYSTNADASIAEFEIVK